MTGKLPQAKAAGRMLFIDNLRSAMIVLVISMHAADTYSPLGSWYYVDRRPLTRPELLVFAAWQMFLQAFFMGLLFFVAAVFTPASFDRKGARQFIRDRLFRLGLPVLFYMFVLGPVTEYFFSHSWTSTRPTSFANEWIKHIRNGEFLQENGPLWFCLALLIFSFVYAGWRVFFRKDAVPARPVGSASLIFFIVSLGTASAVARLCNPPNFLNMHLADFPQYVLMFAAGIAAARTEWITSVTYAASVRWLVAALTVGLGVWLFIIQQACAFCPGVKPDIGFKVAFSFWEAFTCVAVSVGLLGLFRQHFASQGTLAKFMSANAFAVYVFHPPIVIAGARLLHGVMLHPFAKFGLLWAFALVTSYLLSNFVFRRIALLRAIL